MSDGRPRGGPSHAGGPPPGRVSRRRALGALAVLVAAVVAVVVHAVALLRRREEVTDGLVLLDATGPDGTLLDLDGLLDAVTNGVGQDERDDALLDAETLEVLSLAPLEPDARASARLALPEDTRACLSLSWPTSAGYSALLVDLPGPGRYALAELAARSLHEAQEDERDTGALIDPVSGMTVEALRERTAAALDACRGTEEPASRAVRAAAALEAACAAQSGLDRARAHSAPGTALLGVTFTHPPSAPTVGRVLEPLTDAGRDLLVRLVITDASDDEEMTAWRSCLDELHAQGAKAMVQVCDSIDLSTLDDENFNRRLDRLIEAFPDADAWETGNEIGGDWLGEKAIKRTLKATRRLSESPQTSAATRVLTLYYQLGQGQAENSTFTVAQDALAPELLELSDVVGLSVYPQWHPLGCAADRVLDALSALAGDRLIALSELGYGAEDLDDGPWWYGSPTDTSTGRAVVARDLTAAALGRHDVWAAPLWWYYLEDEIESVAGVGSVLANAAAAPSEGGEACCGG